MNKQSEDTKKQNYGLKKQFLGLKKQKLGSQKDRMGNEQAQGAQELVERARLGDQNAMGMLEMVGKNARMGNERAQNGLRLIHEYIQNNPAKSPMGAEELDVLGILKEPNNPPEEILAALCTIPQLGNHDLVGIGSVILANGDLWTQARVNAIDAQLQGPEQNLFRYGYSFSSEERKLKPIAEKLPTVAIGYLCAGHIIGTARKIQLVRQPGVSVGLLSPEIGWEFGC